MKIKKIYFLLLMLLAVNFAAAQSINDTIFKNVIRIDETVITQYKNDYLIDAVIDIDVKKNLVLFNNTRQSKEVLVDKIFRQKSIIIITPDWKFYDAVAEEAEKIDGCIKPVTTNILYQKRISKNTITIDSIRISGKQPKLIFEPTIQQLEAKNNIVYYHMETFGSSCCPKDPKWDIKQKLDEFISIFEKEHKVKIGDIYKKIEGKEGEHTLYFTLSNLTSVQKLIFLQQIRFVYRKKASDKHQKTTPEIFIPKSINKNNLQLIAE